MKFNKKEIINPVKNKIFNRVKLVLLFLAFILLVTFTLLLLQLSSKSLYTASLEMSVFDVSQLNNLEKTNEVLKTQESLPINNNSTPPVLLEVKKQELDAVSAISVQIDSDSEKVLFKMNENKKLPIASLTKLMTALIVLEKYNLNQKVVIDGGAMAQMGEQGSLKLGETLSVKNLLYITLIESSNKSSYALAKIMGINEFVALMNQRAGELGLLNTRFEDSSGLSPKSYSTAIDVTKLSGYLFKKYELFREIIGLKEYDLYLDSGIFHHKLINTNKLLGEASGIIGGKTGFTNEANGCLMTIQKTSQPGKYIINVILGSEDRFSAMKELINKIE